MPRTFGEELAFLRQHTEILVLEDKADGGRIAIAPRLQGRVLSSSIDGENRFGWINHAYFAARGPRSPDSDPGGEDGFRIGPEGSPFGFVAGSATIADVHHQGPETPPDGAAAGTMAPPEARAFYASSLTLTNRAGTVFPLTVERTVQLLRRPRVEQLLQLRLPPSIRFVAFESRHDLINAGNAPWHRDTGLPVIGALSTLRSSAADTILLIPLPGATPDAGTPGPLLSDTSPDAPTPIAMLGRTAWFGAAANADGWVGIRPDALANRIGVYNAADRTLTVVEFSRIPTSDTYTTMNSEADAPAYNGDVARISHPKNRRLSGRTHCTRIESAAAAVALRPGGRLVHRQRIFHFTGNPDELNTLSLDLLGVTLDTVTAAWKATPAGRR